MHPVNYSVVPNCPPTLSNIPKDLIIEIVMRCLGNIKNVQALTCTNSQLYKTIQELLSNISSLCPKLTFVDTTALCPGVQVPLLNKYALIEAYHTLAPHVEGDKGVSYLTLFKGTTIAKLAQIAQARGINLIDMKDIKLYTADKPVPETYTVAISNNIIIGSRKKLLNTQSEEIQGIGGRLTTFQELLALCIFTNGKDSQVSYGTTPRTIGRTSTLTDGKNYPLAVGDNQPNSILLSISSHCFISAITGAGACRRL